MRSAHSSVGTSVAEPSPGPLGRPRNQNIEHKAPEKWCETERWGELGMGQHLPTPFTFCSLFEKWGHNSILARQRFWLCAPGHTGAARGWASAHSFPEVTPPGQTGLGSRGGSFYSACTVREPVYLTWLEAECWPCKHSLSYDTNRTCSQKKYLKNANRQKEILNDGKRKSTQGGEASAGRREGKREGQASK